jgi:hypothetical protein
VWRGYLTRKQLIHAPSCPTPHAVSDVRHNPASLSITTRLFSKISALVTTLPLSTEQGGNHMQQLITFLAVVAGLVFSVAVALVVEELIFGQVFQLFFTPQRAKAANQR